MKKLTQNKFLTLAVILLLLANLGLLLYFVAFRHEHRHGDMKSHSVSDFVQKELNFNDDQKAKFKQLRDQHKETVRPFMESMHKLKDSLFNLLRNPQTNDSVISPIINQIGAKQTELELMIFHHFQKVRALCDSSQLPKFESLVHHMINHGPRMRKGPPEKDDNQ
jgi:Spy/CpxP family protein refolding chaperone